MQKETPKKPYELEGKIRHLGWDIPTEYCVDADGKIWKNHAHGGDPDEKCSLDLLLSEACDDPGARATILKHFGEPDEDEGKVSFQVVREKLVDKEVEPFIDGHIFRLRYTEGKLRAAARRKQHGGNTPFPGSVWLNKKCVMGYNQEGLTIIDGLVGFNFAGVRVDEELRIFEAVYWSGSYSVPDLHVAFEVA